MIYFTTFILALFLTQIACAQQQTCGDAVSPELFIQDEQQNLPLPILATYSKKYDNKDGLFSSTECPNLFPHYKHFKDIRTFPRIGGSYDIRSPNSPNCAKCWNITHHATHKSIFITAIDSAKIGYFNLSEEAFKLLNNGHLDTQILVEAKNVSHFFCLPLTP
jgi:hypothetical protein